MAGTDETPSYREAMGELQEIIDRLRNTEDVARAKELIDFCGGKIRRADAAIKTIVAELQAGQAQGPGEAATPPGDARGATGGA